MKFSNHDCKLVLRSVVNQVLHIMRSILQYSPTLAHVRALSILKYVILGADLLGDSHFLRFMVLKRTVR